MDIRSPLPFEDGSVSHVFSEHVIEHIERDEALRLLIECRRVLRPGGVVRITTPDLVWLVDSYMAAVTDGWGDLWQPQTPARMINEGMRYWGHCFIYDRPELARIFREAGFNDIRFVDWRMSDDPILKGIESRPHNHEIIVEARVGSVVNIEASYPVLRRAVDSNGASLLSAQGAQLETLRVQLDGLKPYIADIQRESGERAERLHALEGVYRSARMDADRLQSEKQSLQATVLEFSSMRLEIERLKGELESVSQKSRERSERIDQLAAALARHEAYIARVRSAWLGRLLLRFFKS